MAHIKNHPQIISGWLFFTAFMVFAMAVIGAITRLTESGLSMVEWRPLIGTLPPMSESEWERVFSLYQETPEYQKKNFGMEIGEFKNIFFWEWFHRLWGRMIGIIYALPFFYFLIAKKIPHGFHLKLWIGLLLGAAQGVMGWYMVKSGLIDRPSVSHFRLAAHLSLAFIIFCYLLWVALDIKGAKTVNGSFCQKRHGWTTFAFVFTTLIWGAFVAGLDAGLVYNSWPMMGSQWIPDELTSFSAIFTDPVAVQFTHRWIAVITALMILSFAYRLKSFGLAGMVLLQIGLGVSTLLTQVPIVLAALHQAGAFILGGLMIYQLHRLRSAN
jgi:cytochrome c oxidase assembly protein subunit 15